jgi:hypothetical protein
MDGYYKKCGNEFYICNILNEDTQQKIDRLMFNFGEFLKEKNKRYGDSAISPMQLFSKLDASNSIAIRIDDKLNRIKNSQEGLRKADVCDLFGYLALLMIEKDWITFKEEID